MLLTIDIGNTQTVLGVYENRNRECTHRGEAGDERNKSAGCESRTKRDKIADHSELLHMWRIATKQDNTADDVRVRLFPLFNAIDLDFAQIESCVLASVVPSLTQMWTCAVDNLANIETQVCTVQMATDLGLFKASYPNPSEIGADRVADAVAMRMLFGAPSVVVDFGTATNIEVIDKQGCFIGGIIAPGVQTGVEALFSHATRLAEVDLAAPHTVIGTSTGEAIRSGIIYGEAERVDGLVRRIFAEMECTCPVVATGGLAHLIAKHSCEITDVLPELTLEGLRFIAEAQSQS